MEMNRMSEALADAARKGRELFRAQKLFRYCTDFAAGLCYRKLLEVPERIMRISAGLKNAPNSVEKNFMDAGQRLQTIYAGISELTREIREATSVLAGTGDDNILAGVELLAGDSQKSLAGHQDRVATSLEPVRGVIDYLDSLCQSCDHIDRMAMNLRVVGLNIGVESTRSPEARDMFTIVADEIVQLSNKVNAAGSLIRKDAEEARAEEILAVEGISKGLQELQSLSADVSKAVSAAVGEIKSCVHSATAVFDQSRERSDQIAREVGEIVAGIQFHDSMRQRVEHIVDALVGACQKITEKSSGTNGGSITARFGETHDVGALQVLQLRDVVKEIGRVHEKSAGAFERIGGEMKALSESLKTAWGDAGNESIGMRSHGNDPFKRLIGALEQLKTLMERADMLVGEIDNSVTRSAAIGTRFSQHMKSIERIGFETHMKALNAIVRAAHLGEKGQTLEVLAQEMSRLSRDARGFVAKVIENLGQMGDCAAKLRDDSNGTTDAEDGSSAHRGEAVETLSRGIDSVSENKNRLMDRMNLATRRAETLCGEIADTVKGLQFLPELETRMSGYMEELMKSLGPLKRFGEKSQGETARLSESYTMQRERDIHDRMFVGGNYLEGDTELFLPEDASHGDEDGNVELFTDPAEQKKKDEGKDFGDNVELF